MRKTILVLAASLAIAGSADAQKAKHETLEGNGKRQTKEFPVSSFESLKASGVFELHLSQGSESVRVEADENLLPYFDVRNEGKQLVIDTKEMKNLRSKNRMRVYVGFKTLKQMDLRMVGSVMAEAPLRFAEFELNNNSVGSVSLELSADKLLLKNASVGEVELAGKVQSAVVRNNSVGRLKAGRLVVQTMNIDNDGMGEAEVNAEKELTVKDNLMSRVKNRGAAPVRKRNKVEI